MRAKACKVRLLYLNPNSTDAMTQSMVAAAQAAAPWAEISGWTNVDGPPAIQGAADGAAAVPGLQAMLPEARAFGADALVIGCFDDTGLAEIRSAAHCPVIGIGQAAYHMAALLGQRFSVVTTLPVSVPVIRGNIDSYGFAPNCVSVRASGLSVLEVEAGGSAVLARLGDEIVQAGAEGAQSVVLGCAGMAPLRSALAANTPVPLVDGVAAAARLASAMVQD